MPSRAAAAAAAAGTGEGSGEDGSGAGSGDRLWLGETLLLFFSQAAQLPADGFAFDWPAGGGRQVVSSAALAALRLRSAAALHLLALYRDWSDLLQHQPDAGDDRRAFFRLPRSVLDGDVAAALPFLQLRLAVLSAARVSVRRDGALRGRVCVEAGGSERQLQRLRAEVAELQSLGELGLGGLAAGRRDVSSLRFFDGATRFALLGVGGADVRLKLVPFMGDVAPLHRARRRTWRCPCRCSRCTACARLPRRSARGRPTNGSAGTARS